MGAGKSPFSEDGQGFEDLYCAVKRFYHDEPLKMTLGNFWNHARRMKRIADRERGVDPDKPRPMDTEEYIKALLAGEIDKDYLKKLRRDPKTVTEEERVQFERTLRERVLPVKEPTVIKTFERIRPGAK